MNFMNTTYQETEIDLSQPFKPLPLRDAILHFNSAISAEQIDELNKARAVAQQYLIRI